MAGVDFLVFASACTVVVDVYQRQLMKQDLSKTVVDDGNAGGPQKGSFSTDELRALFKVDVEKWMGLCLRMQP
eukprot:scaffold301210_cov14-Tisochrysis_lutea.AAC.1